MCYFAGSAGTIPGARFSSGSIAKMPGLTRVYYANSGSEANEKAFKMVRQIAHKHHGGRSPRSSTATATTTAPPSPACRRAASRSATPSTGPFTPGFVQVPTASNTAPGDLAGEGYGQRAADAIEEVILREGPDTIGALCLEPITAGRRHHRPAEGLLGARAGICRKYDILLHIDEVVCGFGRTGTWFGYQQFGVQPDIVTMAKGVASGYAAISCCVTTEAVFDLFKDDTDRLGYFRDISTFGGCTAGPPRASRSWRSPRRRTSSATPPAWAPTSTKSSGSCRTGTPASGRCVAWASSRAPSWWRTATPASRWRRGRSRPSSATAWRRGSSSAPATGACRASTTPSSSPRR
jgi:taurine-pyruvate aminotransferase